MLVIGAIGTSSASAVTAGWMVGGTNLTTTAALATTAAVEKDARLQFSAITVACSGKNVRHVAPVIESPNRGSATSVQFSDCASLAGSKCQLSSTEINTLPVSVEVTLEGTSAVKAVLKPKTGTVFATIEFTGATCSISGEVQAITGKVSGKEPTGRKEMAAQEIVAQPSGEELFVGESSATLEASALFRLASGLPWDFL
jgi:hypothetical protein